MGLDSSDRPARAGRRGYTDAEKDAFFRAVERLGSRKAAARELGVNANTSLAWVPPCGRVSGARYGQEKKDEFFTVLDRLGRVSAAARQVGVNVQTAFKWAEQARVAGVDALAPGTRTGRLWREPTAEAKEEFFTTLTRVGSVTLAARRLGLNPRACSKWARAAGIASVHPGIARRAEFARLRAAGYSLKEAATAAGVSQMSARKWERETSPGSERVTTASGQVPGYNEKMTATATEEPLTGLPNVTLALAGQASTTTGLTGPGRPVAPRASLEVTIEALEKPISTRYLCLREREEIAHLLREGASVRGIARALGRSASSISREITRHEHPSLGYQPFTAHRASVAARARFKPSKLKESGRLREYVKKKLGLRWSPEQISNTLVMEFPDDETMRVSTETIYQSLYVQARGGLKLEVANALRSGRTHRKPHRSNAERTPRFRDPMINISERPAIVEDRAVPGHWEGDLITGAYNRSAIGTLVERTTRYVMLVHLPHDHEADTVRDGLIKTMSTLPAHLRGSLTWDQGSEMATHKAFQIATGIDVYFCNPHSPWERGSNENTNGLLRQYFPKSTDLSVHSEEDLEYVAQELNNRPRKTLNWKTPAQALRDLIDTN